MVPLPNIFLTRLFSKLRLKRKDFQEKACLAWAQEVPGSNPGSPTKLILRIFFSLSKWLFTLNFTCGILHRQKGWFCKPLNSHDFAAR